MVWSWLWHNRARRYRYSTMDVIKAERSASSWAVQNSCTGLFLVRLDFERLPSLDLGPNLSDIDILGMHGSAGLYSREATRVGTPLVWHCGHSLVPSSGVDATIRYSAKRVM